MTPRIGGGREVNPSRPYWLYRCLDRDGALLHLGIARDPLRRLREHAGQREWFAYVAKLDIDAKSWPSRDDAERAEREAIKTGLPLFNRINADARQHAAAIVYVRRQGHDSAYYEWRLCSHMTGARCTRGATSPAEIRRMADTYMARLTTEPPASPDQSERPA